MRKFVPVSGYCSLKISWGIYVGYNLVNCVFTKHLKKDYPSHLRVWTMSQNFKLFIKRLSQCSKLPNILPWGHNRHVTEGFFATTVWKGSIYNAFKNMNSTPRSWRSGWLTGSAQNSFCGREKWRCIFIRCSPSPGPGRPSAAHSTPVLWLVTSSDSGVPGMWYQLSSVWGATDLLIDQCRVFIYVNSYYTFVKNITVTNCNCRTQGYTPPVGRVTFIVHKANVKRRPLTSPPKHKTHKM